MAIAPGARLRASNSTVEVVVVKAPEGDDALLCDGAAMTTDSVEERSDSAGGEALLLGKRYSVAGSGLEVLCVAAGPGPLTLGGQELSQQEAKALPASD